jgi:hypothetical protein
VPRWICGELALEESLPAGQHRAVNVTARKEKQVL